MVSSFLERSTVLSAATASPLVGPHDTLVQVAAEARDEIIITARRRAEDVQDMPIAVSVVTGQTLDALGAFNISRLVQLQPSVQFISSNPRNSAINNRGKGAPFGLTRRGGTVFNTVTQREVDETDNIDVRGQLLWRPTDTIEMTVSGD